MPLLPARFIVKKILLLLSSDYPYGNGESFLAGEMPYLSGAFDEVHILTRGRGDQQSVSLPSNVKTSVITGFSSGIVQFIKALALLFNKDFLGELKQLKRINVSRSFLVYKIALRSLLRAKAIARYISLYIQQNTGDGKLFLYSYWTDEAALAAVLTKRRHPGITAFSRMHGWDLYFERHPACYLPYRPVIISGLEAVFVNSMQGIIYLNQKFGGQYNDRLLLSRLGIEDHFNVTVKQATGSGETFRIISCSAAIQIKRISLIAEALSLLDHEIKIEWHHAGAGPLLEETRNYTDKLSGTQKNINCFFYGQIPNEVVFGLYKEYAFDLFINVSETEGFPVSLMEAMSFGVPVIATGVGGVPEIIMDAYNGFLLPGKLQAGELAEKIAAFIRLSPDKKNELRSNARHTWEEKFNAVNNYRQFTETIIKLN
jgi:colanic acid/amylovoran biosynthesis glycosyltransferase